MLTHICENSVSANRKLERRLDAVFWGLFFIWIGIALLAHTGWGVGLMGVAILILGGQVTRYYSGLKVVGFGVVLGSLFFLCGIWEMLHVRLDLIPVLCIGMGVVLLVSVLVGKKRNHMDRQNYNQSETPKDRASNQKLIFYSGFPFFL